VAIQRTVSTKRLLIVSHDVVGSRMAGPGIRYWELARVLAHDLAVTLAAPTPVDLEREGFATASYAPGEPASLAALADGADVILANGFVLLSHPELAAAAAPLMLDLYDPTLLENLELFRGRGGAERARQHRQDLDLLAAQLDAGDAFLCATERQRDLYIGALMARGRVSPERADADPLLRGLIDVVSFGLPSEPPRRTGPALRGVLPGIGPETPLLLWTGGLWDWMDPATLIRAMPAVLAEVPDARLVFLAGRHPGAAAEMRAPAAARALAAELGLLGGAVQFYDEWVPYARRADFLLDADLLASLHRPGLESAYAAVRSRFLDHLWAGRASLVSAGDAAAALVERHGLGRTVPPEDPAATAAAIVALLADPAGRSACAGRAAALAADFAWERVATPIHAFCACPRHTRPGLTAGASDSGGAALSEAAQPVPDAGAARAGPAQKHDERDAMSTENHFEQEHQELVRRLEARWQLGAATGGGGPAGLLRRLLLRLLAPLLAEQREFNAALVRLFYLERQNITRVNALTAQVVSAHDRIGALSDYLAATARDLHGRADSLAAFDGELNDRVARLAHTAALLNDAVAAADEAAARLAAEVGALKARDGEAVRDA